MFVMMLLPPNPFQGRLQVHSVTILFRLNPGKQERESSNRFKIFDQDMDKLVQCHLKCPLATVKKNPASIPESNRPMMIAIPSLLANTLLNVLEP